MLTPNSRRRADRIGRCACTEDFGEYKFMTGVAECFRGFVALGMETLTKDADGRLVVLEAGEAVAVVDEEAGLGYVFTRR